jgi:hypothetical protein
MQKIISEGVGYQTASLAKLQNISAGITSLVRHFVGEKEVRDTKAEAARAGMSPELAAELKAVEMSGSGGTAAVATKYVKQRQEATGKLEGLESVDKQLSQIKDKATFTATYQAWEKKRKNQVGPPTEADAEITKYLAEMAKKNLTGEAFQKDLIKRKADMAANKTAENKKVENANASLKTLNDINESSEAMAMIMAADMTPEQTSKLYDLMKAQAVREGKKTLGWHDVQKLVKSGTLTHTMFEEAGRRTGEKTVTGDIKTAPTATTATTPTKKDIKDVIRGGMVNVKSGDVVVDKNSLAQVLGGSPGSAIPFMKGGATAGGTVPGGNSIVITVNANEKDLGTRIANEIKGALYQLNVVGR